MPQRPEQQVEYMHERIRDQCELAITYAQDGAYASAARVLRSIAQETQAHASRVKALFDDPS